MLKAENRIKVLRTGLRPQENLLGEKKPMQMKTKHVSMQRELEELQSELSKLKKFKAILDKEQQPPFVWDIGYVEVFKREKCGFDIVIGNPPYVRQEKIRDPQQDPRSITTNDKRIYKEKLAQSVYCAFPKSFGYKVSKGTTHWKINKKSDLYIYFYLIGLSLLNPQGSFCFITSNSWLDVGYGKDLQEFLLTRGHVKLILDNEVKRSFAGADVNTIIALLGAPIDNHQKRKESLKNTARFVMAQTPFENLLHAIFWQEIEAASKRESHPEYRVFPRLQQGLYDDGMDPEKGKFAGDKWGGKFLRAPDIYWHIMEKCKDKLVRLGDIADVRRGVTTGANEFFYLDEEKINKWGIEEKFLVPVIFSLKEIITVEDNLEKTKKMLFHCNLDKQKLSHTKALKYILWGEKQKYHERPSCKARPFWYCVANNWVPAPFIFPAKVGERFLVLNNKKGYLEDKKLYGITPKSEQDLFWACYLNCVLTMFFMQLTCRQLTGAQAIADVDVRVVEDIPVIHPKFVNMNDLKTIYDKNKSREISNKIIDEYKNESRIMLDSFFLNILNLSSEELKNIYTFIIEIINSRLEKAKNY